MHLWVAGPIVFALNLPFGYLRASARKLSVQWFLAIHAPVVFVIVLRLFGGLEWGLLSLPVLVGAFSLGQFLGGRLRLLCWQPVAVPTTTRHQGSGGAKGREDS